MNKTLFNKKEYSSERDQAKVRVVLCTIVLLYTAICFYFGLLSQAILVIYFCSIPLVIGIFLWAAIKPGDSPALRLTGMVADLGTTTLVMSLSGEAATPLFMIYLWTTFGNGFRFGRTYLYISMSMSLAGFSLVLFFSPFWSEQLFLGAGLLATLSVLPVYIATLLTRLQMAIEMAQNASREKSQFLASMSHEIRTPLNGVVGMSDLLSSTQMSVEQKEFIGTIQSSAKTLLALIENILDISKIEAGKTELESVDFDLHELLNHITKMLFPHAEAKGLKCKLHIAADVPYRLHGDSLHLRQVLINLIGNATKFTEEGSIEVNLTRASTQEEPVQLRFEIVDTGIGIANDAQDAIFETFTQADQSTNRKYGGTGLGTAISKKLVTLMGGTIGVQSELEQGSTFWFELDYDKQARAQEQTEVDEIISSTPNILLIATIGKRHNSLVQHLENWNFKWEHAQTQQEASTKLQNAAKNGKPYGVALIDHQTLGQDVTAFTEQLFQNPFAKQTNMILISQSGLNTNLQHQFLSSGFFCILEAPVEKRLLFNALHATSLDQTPNTNITRLVNFKPQPIGTPEPLNILVGEDNQTNQKVIGTILKYAGHQVDIVNNGLEVLDAIEIKKYDLLIIDMHMPEMDGIEASKALRFMQTGSERLPIIMLTADATTDAIKASEDAGIDIYLTKPIESEKLLSTITSLSPRKLKSKKKQTSPVKLTVTEETLDYESLNKISALSESVDFMHDLIQGFLSDTEKLIKQIESEAQMKNFTAIQDHAHAIKGSARSIGAMSLAEIAAEIQNRSNDESIADLLTLCTTLNENFELTKSSLAQYLKKLDSAALL